MVLFLCSLKVIFLKFTTDEMLETYSHILIAAWKQYRLGLRFWGWVIFFPTFILFTRLTLLLDRIFFPRYAKEQIKKPVFIIGNPRSGTSFLHRLLCQTNDFVAFETWQLFVPSLTARVLVKPIVNYLIKSGRTKLMPEESGHEFYINAIEHDEFLFVHNLDTQFVILLSPLAFDDKDYPELCFYDQQPESRRQNSVRFFKSCLQRQAYYLGKEQVIAHTHFSTCRVKTLLEAFPDAKFIYLVRSPYETIPSHLTLEYNTFKNQNRLNDVPSSDLQRYFNRRYNYDLELYRYFYELQKNQEIPAESLLVVPYQHLKKDLAQTVEQIMAFIGIKPSAELQQVIQQQAESQFDYQRKHKLMNLEDFGLTTEKIAQDFSFVFDEYGFDKTPLQNK